MAKKGLISEFKEFISRGNVIDMAVGVIIGGAFTAIVNSLVKDIVMPFIGLITGGINFTELKYVIKSPIESVEPATINYGVFLQSVINFLLTALVIFLVVKAINSVKRKKEEPAETPVEKPVEEPAPEEPSEEVKLLSEIRDLLKKE